MYELDFYNEGYNYMINNYNEDYSTMIEDYLQEDINYLNEDFIFGCVNAITDIYNEDYEFCNLVESFENFFFGKNYLLEDAYSNRVEKLIGRKLNADEKGSIRKAGREGLKPSEAVKYIHGAGTESNQKSITKKDVNNFFANQRKENEQHKSDLKSSKARAAAMALLRNGKNDKKARAAARAAGIDDATIERVITERVNANKANRQTKGGRIGVSDRHNEKVNSQKREDNFNKDRESEQWRTAYDNDNTTKKGKRTNNANQTGIDSGAVNRLIYTKKRVNQLDVVGLQNALKNPNLTKGERDRITRKLKEKQKIVRHLTNTENSTVAQISRMHKDVEDQKNENRKNGNPGQDAGNQVVAAYAAQGKTTPVTKGVQKDIRKEAEKVNAQNSAANEATNKAVETKATTPAPAPAPAPDNTPSTQVAKKKGLSKGAKIGIGAAGAAAAITGGVIAGKAIMNRRAYKKWLAANNKTSADVSYAEWKSKYKNTKKALAEDIEVYNYLDETINLTNDNYLLEQYEIGVLNEEELLEAKEVYDYFKELDMVYLETYYDVYYDTIDKITFNEGYLDAMYELDMI